MTGDRNSNLEERFDKDELRQRQEGGVGARCWAGVFVALHSQSGSGGSLRVWGGTARPSKGTE